MDISQISIQNGVSCNCGNCPACSPGGGAQVSGGDAPLVLGRDDVDISDEAKDLNAREVKETSPDTPSGEGDLSGEEQEEVKKMEERDREVRAHENAHAAAGAGIAMGGPVYKLEMGPDGQTYAVSGHVKLDTGKEKTPEETIAKMQQVKRAALAPAEPSGTDRQVAAEAAQKESEARKEAMDESAASGLSEDTKTDEVGAAGIEVSENGETDEDAGQDLSHRAPKNEAFKNTIDLSGASTLDYGGKVGDAQSSGINVSV